MPSSVTVHCKNCQEKLTELRRGIKRVRQGIIQAEESLTNLVLGDREVHCLRCSEHIGFIYATNEILLLREKYNVRLNVCFNSSHLEGY